MFGSEEFDRSLERALADLLPGGVGCRRILANVRRNVVHHNLPKKQNGGTILILVAIFLFTSYIFSLDIVYQTWLCGVVWMWQKISGSIPASFNTDAWGLNLRINLQINLMLFFILFRTVCSIRKIWFKKGNEIFVLVSYRDPDLPGAVQYGK